jgi:diadenosine tetraphosphate (Ap4A) HIT family hydrolase
MVPERDTSWMDSCPFCERIARHAQTRSNHVAVAFEDQFPVSDGHMLIVPYRHVARLEDLEPPEWTELFALVHAVARDVAGQAGIDGVNVGFNSGTAAGQTVEHAHLHVIPRRAGDVPDPRGGVRHVIPDRADYWTSDE